MPPRGPGRRAPIPGLVLLHSVDRPRCDVLPLREGALVIARGEVAGVHLDDPQLSRRHARVRLDGDRWQIVDLGSRNGTWVQGKSLSGMREGAELRVVRAGCSVFLLSRDVEPFRTGIATVGGTVLGPTLARVWEQIGRAARSGTALHIRGESGTGKERAARAFHGLGPRRDGPFVAVNCATIPEGLAERLLFGARKGAYSGAMADAEGYVQAAHGGVLFLDEVAELDGRVQAKLLRALESREVIPLGASRPVRVDFALVSATHRDLRALVAAGKLREDLFFRIALPLVQIPSLYERPEELAWLVAAALNDADTTAARGGESAEARAHASLIEACLLRAWPGNVRELLAETSSAVQEARAAGSSWVKAEHLSPSAGEAFIATPSDSERTAPAELPAWEVSGGRHGTRDAPQGPAAAGTVDSFEAIEARRKELARKQIVEALEKCGHNQTKAAQLLGIARRTMTYKMHQLHIDGPRVRRREPEEPGPKGG